MDSQLADDVINASVTIPTLPSVVNRIQKMLGDPNVSLKAVGEEASKDAPITAKVLRIANSAFYGLRERVVSTEHASSVLGLEVLRNIVLQASVLDQWKHLSESSAIDVVGLWRHSIATAQLCQDLAGRCSVDLGLSPEEFHTAGLLHDIGQVIMLDSIPDKYLSAVRNAQEMQVAVSVAEQKNLGFDHAQVGARVAHRWGLPDELARAILLHHGTLEQVLEEPPVALVALANVVGEVLPEHDRELALSAWMPQLGACLGLRIEDFVRAVDRAIYEFDDIEI